MCTCRRTSAPRVRSHRQAPSPRAPTDWCRPPPSPRDLHFKRSNNYLSDRMLGSPLRWRGFRNALMMTESLMNLRDVKLELTAFFYIFRHDIPLVLSIELKWCTCDKMLINACLYIAKIIIVTSCYYTTCACSIYVLKETYSKTIQNVKNKLLNVYDWYIKLFLIMRQDFFKNIFTCFSHMKPKRKILSLWLNKSHIQHQNIEYIYPLYNLFYIIITWSRNTNSPCVFSLKCILNACFDFIHYL